jgi:hypothetical protein
MKNSIQSYAKAALCILSIGAVWGIGSCTYESADDVVNDVVGTYHCVCYNKTYQYPGAIPHLDTVEQQFAVSRSDSSDDKIMVDGIELTQTHAEPSFVEFSFPSGSQRTIISATFFPQQDSMSLYHSFYMVIERRCRGVK